MALPACGYAPCSALTSINKLLALRCQFARVKSNGKTGCHFRPVYRKVAQCALGLSLGWEGGEG